MLGGDDEFQIDAGECAEGRAALPRTDSEAAVEVADECLLEITICGLIVGNVVQAQLLREAALQGPEAALGTAAGLWRHRPDVLDPQRPQDAGDLAVLLVSRGVAGALGAAEVASSVRVELAEAPVLLQDVKQRRHRRGDALLRKEPAEEDTTVRIVHRHDQVLGRQSLHPVMGRRIEVQEHPRQRPTLALAQIAAAAMALIRETAELQQIPNEGVGHPDPMPLDEMLVKMPDGRSEEHTSELQSHSDLVCRLLLEKKNKNRDQYTTCDAPDTHVRKHTGTGH